MRHLERAKANTPIGFFGAWLWEKLSLTTKPHGLVLDVLRLDARRSIGPLLVLLRVIYLWYV